MFDNIGTVIVQAVGFLVVFGFFVYQLLLEGKKTTTNQSNSSRKIVNVSKDLNDKPKKKRLFGKKVEPKKEEVNTKKKGLFGKKVELKKEEVNTKKKGWFN